MSTKTISGVRRDQEVHINRKMRDTRSFTDKIAAKMKVSDNIFIMLSIALLLAILVMPFSMEFLMFFMAILSLVTLSYGANNKLLFRTPQSSGEDGADGIYYMGSDKEFDNQELWFNDSDVRKHMLLFGTTGAGKTEALLSICYGALLSCSGFIYSDGKGTFELYYKVFNTCRSLGQEDDLLLMSFLTGDEDVKKATTIKISNDLNPFAESTQDASTQLLVSLMSDGSGDGMWKDRASVLMESIMGLLVFRRDEQKRLISVDSIRESLILQNIYNAWNNAKNAESPDSLDYLPSYVVKSLHGYLVSLPGFKEDDPFDKQPEVIEEQHGYLYMQFTKLLGSLADMYGYIFNTQLSEIDFWDIVVKRRVLVVLLPALAKSKNELAMLGKIIIACIKQMMTSGLGKKSEGELSDILKANPTKSKTPFLTILDEYGYYAVQGSSVMPAQARGLGFFMIFAGQDFAAFSASSKEEAVSIVANCKIQVCMALQDEKETYDIFFKKGGQADIEVNTGKEFIGTTNIRENATISYEKRDRITFEDLTSQESGEFHMLFEGKLARGRFFYVAINIEDKLIRVNEFLKIYPPELEEVNKIKENMLEMKEKLTNTQYINNFLEDDDAEGSDDIQKIAKLFNVYKKEHSNSSILASCATIAHVSFDERKRIKMEQKDRNIESDNGYQTSYAKNPENYDKLMEEFNESKKDINAVPIKPYGVNSEEINNLLMKNQMVVNSNINSVKAETKKSIDLINGAVEYPRNILEIKKPKEIQKILEEMNSSLEEYKNSQEDII